MRRLIVSECLATLARALKTCSTDSRLYDYLNDAQERLIPKGRYVGTMVRYRVCVSDSCLVWPRQIETIEGWANCKEPMRVRGRWYEFMSNGPGLRDGVTGCPGDLIDRDPVCVFDSIDDNVSRVGVQADVTESGSARILLQGYDPNGVWVRTQDSGVWVDGEYVSISTTLTPSNNTFVRYLTGVIKPITNGPVRLYQYNPVMQIPVKPLAYYEPDETVPIYRRSTIPNLANACGCDCSGTGGSCDKKTVTVLAKLRHLPVRGPNDFLVLQNLAALKLGVMAVFKEDNNLFEEANIYWGMAVQALEEELNSFEGTGADVPINVADRDLFGAGSVENDILIRW